MTERLKGWLAPLFLAACLILGGASGARAGAIANGLLQMLAIALILYALWTRRAAYPREAKFLLVLSGIFAGFVLLSLIPLPSSLWRNLPGRAPVAEGLRMLGEPDLALPLGLAPQNALSSLVWLLPPLALFLLVLQTGERERRRLAWVVLVVAVLSVLLGAAQLVAGPNSGLRFYEITNPTLPVGFFANGNHQGTFLLCALPFVGYLAARMTQRGPRVSRRTWLLTALFLGLFLSVGVAIIGSLAGYGLFALAAPLAVLVYRRAVHGSVTRLWQAGIGILFVCYLGFALSGPLQQQAVTGKIGDQPLSRKVMALNTVHAIRDFIPTGSGLGSFSDVYRTYEDAELVRDGYVNHAHDDYVEFVLDLGVVGALLILCALGWWLKLAIRAWRGKGEGTNLARAASVAIGVIALHSIVDYPIRTSAIAAIAAIAAALLVRPAIAPPLRQETAPESPPLRHVEAD